MYYIGIDVSSKENALCILDCEGKVVRETTKLPTDPEVISRFVATTSCRSSGSAWNRVVPEPGCLRGCSRRGWPVVCIDARHAAAGLRAGFRNNNDRNDARGIADLMRANKYRPIWVKSPEAQRQGRPLTTRATLQSQRVALENTIRGLLPLLETRNAVLRHRAALDRQILRILRADPVCRLLKTAPVPVPSCRSPSRLPSTIPDGSRARAASGILA